MSGCLRACLERTSRTVKDQLPDPLSVRSPHYDFHSSLKNYGCAGQYGPSHRGPDRGRRPFGNLAGVSPAPEVTPPLAPGPGRGGGVVLPAKRPRGVSRRRHDNPPVTGRGSESPELTEHAPRHRANLKSSPARPTLLDYARLTICRLRRFPTGRSGSSPRLPYRRVHDSTICYNESYISSSICSLGVSWL
jgi:hypothetical protein